MHTSIIPSFLIWMLLALVLSPFLVAEATSYRIQYDNDCRRIGTGIVVLDRFSQSLEHKVPAPGYIESFRMDAISAYLEASGYRSDAVAVDSRYADAFKRRFVLDASEDLSNPLAEKGVRFLPPKGYRVVEKLGSGDKGTVLLIEDEQGRKVAAKIPTGRIYEPGRADLAINLELEFWLNVKLREWFKIYQVRVIPISMDTAAKLDKSSAIAWSTTLSK